MSIRVAMSGQMIATRTHPIIITQIMTIYDIFDSNECRSSFHEMPNHFDRKREKKKRIEKLVALRFLCESFAAVVASEFPYELQM